MSTRCKIVVKDKFGNKFAIYRHSDGYPTGVIADIKAFMELYHDKYAEIHGADYWLANFVFYAKLSCFADPILKKDILRDKWFEYGYGVVTPRYQQSDIEYIYEIDLGKRMVKVVNTFEDKPLFNGDLEVAFDKYGNEFPDGCHISKSLIPKLLEHMAKF